MLFCDDIEKQQLKWRNQDVSSYNDIINSKKICACYNIKV